MGSPVISHWRIPVDAQILPFGCQHLPAPMEHRSDNSLARMVPVLFCSADHADEILSPARQVGQVRIEPPTEPAVEQRCGNVVPRAMVGRLKVVDSRQGQVRGGCKIRRFRQRRPAGISGQENLLSAQLRVLDDTHLVLGACVFLGKHLLTPGRLRIRDFFFGFGHFSELGLQRLRILFALGAPLWTNSGVLSDATIRSR